MRPLACLVLATACSSGPPRTAPAARSTVAAQEPAARLPEAVFDALASENVQGKVVVVAAPLWPSIGAARGAGPPGADAKTFAVRAVADHGDVIEVALEDVDDCVSSSLLRYELKTFVPRAAMLPRATTPTVATFADGTGYAIAPGALVRLASGVATWADPILARTRTRPPATLAYAVTHIAAELPALPDTDELLCPYEGPPILRKAWDAERDQVRKPAGGNVSVLVSVPTCGVAPGKTAKLDGAPFMWTTRDQDLARESVYVRDQRHLADLATTCGTVRVAIAREAAVFQELFKLGGVLGKIGDGSIWHAPKAGPVFWPDGTPAGAYLGAMTSYRDQEVDEVGDLMCVKQDVLASPVCHPKRDVRTSRM